MKSPCSEQLKLIQRKIHKELPWCLANAPVKTAAPSQVFVLEIPCL